MFVTVGKLIFPELMTKLHTFLLVLTLSVSPSLLLCTYESLHQQTDWLWFSALLKYLMPQPLSFLTSQLDMKLYMNTLLAIQRQVGVVKFHSSPRSGVLQPPATEDSCRRRDIMTAQNLIHCSSS